MPGPWRPEIDFPILDTFQVSISTEMPGPWRQAEILWCKAVLEVSISTEMPGPWRPSVRGSSHPMLVCFNLNRDARPLATAMGLAWLWKPFYAIVCEAEVENAHKRYFSTIC